MSELSTNALLLAIVSMLGERRRAIETHNAMSRDDEEFEEVGDIPEQIDRVLGEFEEAYEAARGEDPSYPPFADLLAANR